ncbi:hypothetical protein [Hoylesella saccharolytica]|uniref:hypothetical protein n=1 Tax=Hoylesella saccharolytica TaxID=633701 RepID=UPI0028E26B5E|nr:hypothetical protein [Hoylesella saccharolytica]
MDYKEAYNYFLNQGQERAVSSKITTQKEFDRCFGMAAFMGKGGNPTVINFKKEFVIPIVLPETDKDTDILDVSLEGNERELKLIYRVKEGEQQSFFIQPMKLLIVDNAYKQAQITVYKYNTVQITCGIILINRIY